MSKKKKLKKENAELKRQLEVRPIRKSTKYKVVLCAENIIKNLKEKELDTPDIKEILTEAMRQVEFV